MFTFLDRKVQKESARRLLVQALDFEIKLEPEIEKKNFEEVKIESAIKEDFFPPCIKKMLNCFSYCKKPLLLRGPGARSW